MEEEPNFVPVASPMATPQHFAMASRTDICRPARKFPTQPKPDRHAPRPAQSTRLEPVYRSKDVLTLVPRVLLSITLAGPTPSGSTDASRRCRGCFPPSPAPPGSGCPQLHCSCCDRTGGEGLSPPLDTSAPRGARKWRYSSVSRMRPILPPTSGSEPDRTHGELRSAFGALPGFPWVSWPGSDPIPNRSAYGALCLLARAKLPTPGPLPVKGTR